MRAPDSSPQVPQQKTLSNIWILVSLIGKNVSVVTLTIREASHFCMFHMPAESVVKLWEFLE